MTLDDLAALHPDTNIALLFRERPTSKKWSMVAICGPESAAYTLRNSTAPDLIRLEVLR